jgi:hypothetical protein
MTDEFWQRASEAQEAAYSLHHQIYVLNCETPPFAPEPEDEERIRRLLGNMRRWEEVLSDRLRALYQLAAGDGDE